MVAQGLTNREIAKHLFLSERTVDGHLEHVREKLAVGSRAQIAAWVVRQDGAGSAPIPVQPAAAPVRRERGIPQPTRWVAAAVLLCLFAAGVAALMLQPWRSQNLAGPVILSIVGTDTRDTFPGGGYTGDNGPATGAQLSRPSDVAVGPDGAIYIADQHGVVRRVRADRIITTIAGGGEGVVSENAVATSVQFEYLSNLVVDASDRLFILTSRAGALEVWMVRSEDSTITRVVTIGPAAGQTAGYWNLPLGGLAVSADGTLYVSDRGGNQVWKVPAGGEKSLYAGTGVAGSRGDLGAAISAQLDSPLGLALDDQRGDLYISDSGNNRIRKVAAGGVITTVAGGGDSYGDSGDGGPAVKARLSFPFGVAVRADGALFISDTGNNRLREVTPAGRILALAGSHGSGFRGDGGPASEALLSGPEAVVLDALGDLLVADTENHRVRKLEKPLP